MENQYTLKDGKWFVEEDGEMQELILTTEDDCMYPAY
jgi:hypothetical protein